ncbi:MAG: protein kinase [Myxococcota bacterium]
MLNGRYALMRPLGAGGLGAVFEAHDEKLDRTVAVKLLRGRTDVDSRIRLMREANAMARVSHPNVVQVFDVGRYERLPVGDLPLRGVAPHGVFVVMEIVRGQDLHRWLAKPRPMAQVVEVLQQAARGLAAAHKHGIVHRDFKPANVLLSEAGVAKVTDFGLAAACAADSAAPSDEALQWEINSITAPGLAMGTPPYMAPEQHRGDPIDARADQYAFCLVLAEAVYGRRPFVGNTYAELLRRKLEAKLPSDRSVPRRLRRVIERGLRPAPAERFASMARLQAAMAPRSGWRRPATTFALSGFAVLGLGAWLQPTAPTQDQAIAMATAGYQAAGATAQPPGRWASGAVAFADRPHSPAGPASRRALIRRSMDRLGGGGLSEDPALRTAMIEDVREQAHALGDATLIAEAELFYALDRDHHHDRGPARAAAQESYRLAEATDQHGVAARAASILVGLADGDSDAWQRWARLTELHSSMAQSDAHSELALLQQLGIAMLRQHEFEAALSYWQRAAELASETLGPDHVGTADVLSALGEVYLELENFPAAERALRRALVIAQSLAVPNPDLVRESRIDLAVALIRAGDLVEAARQLDAVILPTKAIPQDDRVRRGRQSVARWELGYIDAALGNHEAAVRRFREALPLSDPDFPHNGLALNYAIAESLLAMGKRGEAIRALEAGLEFTDPDAPEWEQRIRARQMVQELRAEDDPSVAL